jgi:hypothetical protein
LAELVGSADVAKSTSVAILSPGYPDALGGVTDHTARLVDHFAERGIESDVLATSDANPDDATRRWAEKGARGVLIQYVPFLYGRRGLSRLPETVASLARRRALRTVTFVHEPWVPATRLSWLVLSPLQRHQLHRLTRRSDVTVTPVPRWAELLGSGTEVLPVGSTLGDPPPIVTEPALDAPVVFSPFAAGLNWDWIITAVDAIGEGLIVVGADAVQMRRHATAGRYLRASWDCRGRLLGRDVLATLGQASLVLAPFIDGITGRRTSALAALSMGVRTVSSEGALFDGVFGEGPVSLAETRDEFGRTAAEAWNTPDPSGARAQRIEWYRTHFDPRMLDARLLELLLGA